MSRSFNTIFCDDVREEVNGKMTIVGSFNRYLYVESLPIVIPKFCIILQTYSDGDDLLKNFKITIKQNDEEITTQEVDASSINGLSPKDEALPKNSYIPTYTQSVFIVSPLQADKRLVIDIYIEADGETYRAPGLIIDKAPAGVRLA